VLPHPATLHARREALTWGWRDNRQPNSDSWGNFPPFLKSPRKISTY
jgi:hypothetical protein